MTAAIVLWFLSVATLLALTGHALPDWLSSLGVVLTQLASLQGFQIRLLFEIQFEIRIWTLGHPSPCARASPACARPCSRTAPARTAGRRGGSGTSGRARSRPPPVRGAPPRA